MLVMRALFVLFECYVSDARSLCFVFDFCVSDKRSLCFMFVTLAMRVLFFV